MDSSKINGLLVFSFGAAGLVAIVAPVLLGIFLARRCQARWRYWCYGLFVFLLFQGVTRIPVMIFVQTRPSVREALKEPGWFWTFLFCAAFTAGLFEEGGRWLAFRWMIRPEERQWRTALMLGAGHGGLESIGVGLAALASLGGYLAITLLPPGALAGYAEKIEEARRQFAGLPGWEPLLGGWEPLGALAIQAALSVMVLQAFVRRRRWWWYALLAHTVVDFTTVALVRAAGPAWGTVPALVTTEGLVTVYALLGVWLLLALRPRPEAPSAQVPTGPEATHAEREPPPAVPRDGIDPAAGFSPGRS